MDDAIANGTQGDAASKIFNSMTANGRPLHD
jgi:hypothetical protein